MLRLAYMLCSDLSVAEEVVQDAFLQLHLNWSSLLNPVGYLRTSVTNGCRSQLRHRVVVRRWNPPRLQPVFDDHDEIGDALSHLSSRQHAALALRYYLDLSDEDIAVALTVRPATVRSLLRRGLVALREELER
jgi:DNA-directed RNA polymerase specialized sigma24 family protein